MNFKKIALKELAELVSKKLAEHDIKAVLVGGACVSIYSDNKYQSYDLDYVSPDSKEKIGKALKELGFEKKGAFRYYENDDCPFFIEFPPGPIAVGNEFLLKGFSEIGSIVLLNPTDCVKDRLSAYYHWGDDQSLEQALMVAKTQKTNLKEIQRWSETEGAIDKFKKYEFLLRKKSIKT